MTMFFKRNSQLHRGLYEHTTKVMFDSKVKTEVQVSLELVVLNREALLDPNEYITIGTVKHRVIGIKDEKDGISMRYYLVRDDKSERQL